MDPNLDQANQCVECGRPVCGNKHFCSAECFERWMEDDKAAIHLNPGYSLLPIDQGDARWLQPK